MTIKAHFDGKVFVPDEPVNLPPNQPVVVSLRGVKPGSSAAATAARLKLSDLGAHREAIAAGRDSSEVVRSLREAAQRRAE